MAVPPVIQRVRLKGLPEAEIRAFVSKRLTTEKGFEELTGLLLRHVQDVAWRLVMLPDDHPYWAVAYPSGNFMDAISRYLEWQSSAAPEDDTTAWARAALAAYWTDDETSYAAWLPLVERDSRNVRWMIESAVWILKTSGHDSTDELIGTLRRIEAKKPAFRVDLGEFVSGRHDRLAWAAHIALRIVEGERLIRLRELQDDTGSR